MKRIGLFLALAVLIGAAIPAAAQGVTSKFGVYDTPVEYPQRITTSLYLPMRDGVRLAVSITRPARDGKAVDGRFPVIWQHQLMIEKSGVVDDAAAAQEKDPGYRAVPELANYGYVVVQVARRGNGPSFGVRRGYNDRTEAYDAYEVIDWLASQPWSDGKVGIYGCSNTGDAAMHAVTSDNPHLKAAWAGCFSWEKYDGFLRGGILANWGTGPTRTIEEDMDTTPVDGDQNKVLLRQAAEEHQKSTPLLKMWQDMPYRDSDSSYVQTRFWIEGSIAPYIQQINRSGVPIYIQGGWYDDLREQGLVTFANLTGAKHIVIGPWMHCRNGGLNLFAEMHRFFDYYLKGVDTGIENDPPIHYFTINAPDGQAWRSSDRWPVAGMHDQAFHLRTGALTDRAPKAPAATTFTVRYDVDCPPGQTQQALNSLLTGALPCFPETAGPHFTGPALSHDAEVTGSAVADLWIASSAADQNVFAYLEDVAPDGKITKITDGRLKASLRKVNAPPFANYGLPWHGSYKADAEPLTPGQPARLQFDFLPTSYVFKAGHHIRITVAGADYREKDRTPVVPAPTLTLLSDAEHDSEVLLPIIGASDGG